jgi:hypothetical protein
LPELSFVCISLSLNLTAVAQGLQSGKGKKITEIMTHHYLISNGLVKARKAMFNNKHGFKLKD